MAPASYIEKFGKLSFACVPCRPLVKFNVKMDTQKRVVSAIFLLDEAGVIRQKRKPRKYWMKS